MHNVVSREHLAAARDFRATYSRYRKSRDLVRLGVYVAGSDPALDQAIRRQPAMSAFLQQAMHEGAPFATSLDHMATTLA
jgi:flagellum-specific ATP synthase